MHKLDSVREKLKIKAKTVETAATQSQVLTVNDSKGVGGDLSVILKDSTYTDSLLYNALTKVYYTIGKDTVNIALDVRNTQYIYLYDEKKYKNPNKNFIQRLFTWDWKKVTTSKYKIKNTNDLIKTDSVRVVRATSK